MWTEGTWCGGRGKGQRAPFQEEVESTQFLIGRLWRWAFRDQTSHHEVLYSLYSRATALRQLGLPYPIECKGRVSRNGFQKIESRSLRLSVDYPGVIRGVRVSNQKLFSCPLAVLWFREEYIVCSRARPHITSVSFVNRHASPSLLMLLRSGHPSRLQRRS